MSKNIHLDINDIKLDLNNYRTVPQKTEEDAIHAMIAIKSDRFYAVIESLIDDGYLPTENLIILEDNGYTVKEGNRRVAALKIIHGIHSKDIFNLPEYLKQKIDNEVNAVWKKENREVPCSIYTLVEKSKVDKIVNLTHAKGEKASRDPWTSVAKARQNRDEKKGSEPALDMLEKYLSLGKNLTSQQKERWSGDYPLSVLEEALRHIVTRIGLDSIANLVTSYPKVKLRSEIEDLIRDIGLGVFGFSEIRSKTEDFASTYNIPPLESQSLKEPSASSNKDSQPSAVSQSVSGASNTSNASQTSSSVSKKSETTSNSLQSGVSQTTKSAVKPKAFAIHDQRTVTQTLKKFNPKGADRQKLVSLRDELLSLKVKSNPIAFCFLLRSMFEISAKIYSSENSIPTAKIRSGKTVENTLQKQLSAITSHLTSNNTNKSLVKVLHGANSEISKPTGLLSVTSMNQLVHNPSFSIAPHDIFTLFNNVYPLLEAMN